MPMVCLNTNLAGINIKIGVSDIMVLAMPAAVYCTAISEKPTPIRGPQITATTVILIPLESLTEWVKAPISFLIINQEPKQSKPAKQRMRLALKGIYMLTLGKRC